MLAKYLDNAARFLELITYYIKPNTLRDSYYSIIDLLVIFSNFP